MDVCASVKMLLLMSKKRWREETMLSVDSAGAPLSCVPSISELLSKQKLTQIQISQRSKS